jgi:hypothetical protein
MSALAQSGQSREECPLMTRSGHRAHLFILTFKFFYSLLSAEAQSGLSVWVSLCEIGGKQQLLLDLDVHAEKLCVSAQYFLCIRQDHAVA